MDKSTVNDCLTPNRPTTAVENDHYHAFTRRIVAAYSRRVGAGDVEALTALVALADDVDAAIADAVHGLRALGYSWTEIAARLGITRQAANQRWGGDRA